jgi:hypothetical protein
VNHTKSCAVYIMFTLVCQGFDQPGFPENKRFFCSLKPLSVL